MRLYIYKYVSAYVYAPIYIQVCLRICLCAYIYTCMSLHVYAPIYMCNISLYVYVPLCCFVYDLDCDTVNTDLNPKDGVGRTINL